MWFSLSSQMYRMLNKILYFISNLQSYLAKSSKGQLPFFVHLPMNDCNFSKNKNFVNFFFFNYAKLKTQ